MRALLDLRRFSITFGTRRVVHRMTLTLGERGLTALMGPGGAGKSTLLRTLCGINDGEHGMRLKGSVLYRGAPLMPGNRPALVQQKAQMLASTVFEGLVMALESRELTRAQQRDRVTALLVDVGLERLIGRLDDHAKNLSLGDRRLLAVVQQLVSNPALLCLDEPTVGLTELETRELLTVLAREASRRAILMASHHQMHCQKIARDVVLMAGGRLLEYSSASIFFSNPLTSQGAEYIQTGGCSVPPASVSIEDVDPASVGWVEGGGWGEVRRDELDEDRFEMGESGGGGWASISGELDRLVVQRPKGEGCEGLFTTTRAARGPRAAHGGPVGFHWVVPGMLAGTPRPGLVGSPARDLEALQRVGVRLLVTLTEEPFELSANHLEGIHFPIPDMGVPEMEATARLCAELDDRLRQGVVVAFHCKAGLGRTGTMLAAMLIWYGLSASAALSQVRTVQQGYVQSCFQENFLWQWESWCKGHQVQINGGKGAREE